MFYNTMISGGLITLFFATAISGQDAVSKWGSVEHFRAAADRHGPTIASALEVIAKVDDGATELSKHEYEAIVVMKIFREEAAIPELLRVLTQEYHPPPKLRATISRLVIFPLLDKHPAAEALQHIGFPSVLAILEDLEHRPHEISQVRIEIYAEVIRGVLGRQARDIVERHKSAADNGARKRYDDLLAQPMLQPSKLIMKRRGKLPTKPN